MEIKVNGEFHVNDVMMNNGYEKVDGGEFANWKDIADQIQSSGINSTCTSYFWKDGKYFLFDGWEADRHGGMAKNPKYIKIVDVTGFIH